MEAQVKAIKMSILISIISIIATAYFQFYMESSNLQNFCFTITSGIFSGVILTLIIYTTEYKTTKKKALENYYLAATEFESRFANLEYLHFSEPIDLLQDYFIEELNNNNNKEMAQKIKDVEPPEFLKLRYDAKQNLINFLKLSEEDDDFIEREIDTKISEYKEKIDEVITQYMELASFNYGIIENAFGEIYFFSGKKHSNKIYKEIHEKQRNMIKQIQIVAYHFDIYKKSHNKNTAVVIGYINKIQKLIFRVEESEKDGNRCLRIWKKYFFDMHKILEDLRASIYNTNPLYSDEKSKIIMEKIY